MSDLIKREDEIEAVQRGRRVMVKAEWTNKDSLDLQQTCNKLATTEGDSISREGAIECIRWGESVTDVIDRINELPSAETPTTGEKHQLSAETPTTDLISRSDAIEAVDRIKSTDNWQGAVIALLSSLPSAEAVQGEWIDTEFLKLKECSCCHCRWGMYDVKDFDYCPSCGAKMFREDGEE